MAGRTYRYMTDDPLYPFGFGLSYSHFEYAGLALGKPAVRAGESLGVSVKVSNAGQRAAAEVVQFYLSDLEASAPVPLHHLVGFERVFLQPGESRTVQLGRTLKMCNLVGATHASPLRSRIYTKFAIAPPVSPDPTDDVVL